MSRTLAGLRRLRGDGRGWVLFAVAAGWLLVLGGRFLVPAVLPQVKDAFGVGNTGGGVAITVLWAAYALAQSPAGALADRLGERRILVGSLALTAGSTLGLALSPVFLAFVVGCAAFGLSTGLYGPARGMILSWTFPDDDATAIGLTLAAGSIGSAILPYLAGGLVGSVGWAVVVGGLAPSLACAAAFTWWAVPQRTPEDDDRTTSRTDRARTVLRAVRIRGVVVAVAAVTLMLFAFQGLSAFFVTYLVEIKGIDQRVAAGLFALLFVSGAVTQVASGAVAVRFGERWVLVATAAVGAVALAAVPTVGGVLPLAALSLVLGTRLAVMPVSNAYLIDVLPDSVTGTAWGTIRTGFILVGSTGSTVVGLLADRGLFDEAVLLLAGVTAVAAVLYLSLPSRGTARADWD